MPNLKDTTTGNPLALTAKFDPVDYTTSPSPELPQPDESWRSILECKCTFPPEIFETVMSNLIQNPNITSSHLFRADIVYEAIAGEARKTHRINSEYHPIEVDWPGFDNSRTIVRQLVPRNPQLDKTLIQTCHFLQKTDCVENEEQNLVVYIPHVQRPDQMPFYHPCVSQVAFLHRWRPSPSILESTGGSIAILYRLFPGTSLTTKLTRTALRLLETIFKHGQGQLAGYEKRVHHDQVIPQKCYQDTYTMLKAKYGKQLAEQWVEVTDPSKHVFEDIGIAAFLIELWREMYTTPAPIQGAAVPSSELPSFPGFVDIGCGNGILVHILLSEGYPGWGFDARSRKTWSTFPPSTQKNLQQRILVPAVLMTEHRIPSEISATRHGGIFSGEFIISNHADELTAWTPILAFVNDSSFIAIPCCSHDLSGARSRLPERARNTRYAEPVQARLPQQNPAKCKEGQAAETGSLQRTEVQKKMPSAYSTLCSYVTSLAQEMGFKPEQEVLRIPSTRNQCIIGRKRANDIPENIGDRHEVASKLVQTELKKNIDVIGREWDERASKLMQKPSSGH